MQVTDEAGIFDGEWSVVWTITYDDATGVIASATWANTFPVDFTVMLRSGGQSFTTTLRKGRTGVVTNVPAGYNYNTLELELSPTGTNATPHKV
jgi:hypothetical protein